MSPVIPQDNPDDDASEPALFARSLGWRVRWVPAENRWHAVPSGRAPVPLIAKTIPGAWLMAALRAGWMPAPKDPPVVHPRARLATGRPNPKFHRERALKPRVGPSDHLRVTALPENELP